MNEPIISPWIFYIGYLSSVSFCFIIIAIAIVLIIGKDVADMELDIMSLEHRIDVFKKSVDVCDNDEEARKEYRDISEYMSRLDELKTRLHKRKNVLKATIVRLFIVIIAWLIIPNEKAIYRMAVANYVTPHNLQVTEETIEAIVDKTVDKILLLKEAK